MPGRPTKTLSTPVVINRTDKELAEVLVTWRKREPDDLTETQVTIITWNEPQADGTIDRKSIRIWEGDNPAHDGKVNAFVLSAIV